MEISEMTLYLVIYTKIKKIHNVFLFAGVI